MTEKTKQDKQMKNVNLKFNILAVICICIFMIGLVAKTLQNDTYYTITLGKYVLENGIDMMEHFSWHEGLIYTYPHWLYDIFMYLIYNSFGAMGLYISSIVLGCVLGLSIYFVASKISKNNLISFFITLLILFLGRGYITARAQLVTFILFVWTIYFIEKFLETKSVKYALGLIIIPILIANIHAAVFPFYFILFLPYIGEYIIALVIEHSDFIGKLCLKSDKREIDKLLNKKELTEKEKARLELYTKRVEKNEIKLKEKEENRKTKKEYKIIINKNNNVKWLILIMIICAFTGLLTPIGDTPYTYLIHTMKGNTTGNISEHLPLVLYNNKEILLMFTVLIIMLTFKDTKVGLKDLFMIGGLTFLTFMSRRQFSMLLFVGGFSINNIICKFLELHSTDKDIEINKRRIASVLGQLLTYVLIIICTVCLFLKIKDQNIINKKDYPEDACNYILENLDKNKIKLFNDYNFGSYLMFRGIPNFIDSRADVYDPQFNKLDDDIFQDYVKTAGLKVYYEDTFEHYNITHVMTYAKSQLALYISKDENYKELYKDDSFVIFERLKK